MIEPLDEKYLKFKEIQGFKRCKKCGRFFEKNHGHHQHERWCDGTIPIPLEEKEYKCRWCGKIFKNKPNDFNYGNSARNAHQIFCELNPNKEKNCDMVAVKHLELKQSEETKKKISESMKAHFKRKEQQEHHYQETEEYEKMDINGEKITFTDSL